MTVHQRIEDTARQKLNDEDRLELCRLLIKSGYTVKLVKEKPEGKNQYEKSIEFWP